MNVLELFAGAGGGILKNGLLGHRTVCAVEVDEFRRAVLCARQDDGTFPPFPVWDDVRTFDGRPWRGIVDVVSGGFPCQDISIAGPRTGIHGPRSSLWFEMLRIVREVRPGFVFVENSDALVRCGLDVVLGGLAEVGYDAEWLVLGASDVGAPHVRKRCWILAADADVEHVEYPGHGERPGERDFQAKEDVDDAERKRCDSQRDDHFWYERDFACSAIEYAVEMADPSVVGHALPLVGRLPGVPVPGGIGEPGWWSDESGLERVAYGVADWSHRVKATGDGQVPLCAFEAWNCLYRRLVARLD